MNEKMLNDTLIEWRKKLHQIPETAFEERNTSKFIKDKLEEMGYIVESDIGITGLVGKLKIGNSEKVIAIRADMDAINVIEENDLLYKSKTTGKMHACGHDGHIVTALGAAKLLSEEKNFNGTVIFIFQPAEEPGKGALAMIEDGLLEKYHIDEIYAFHNMPQLPEGEIHSKIGPIMGSEDNFKITIKGKGGHSSSPHIGVDPLIIASEIILGLQTIVSRNINPIDSAVISCTEIHTDGAVNVIPSNIYITGDVRSYKKEVQDKIKERMEFISKNISRAYDGDCELHYKNSFYPTINDENCHNAVMEVAENLFGKEKVVRETLPMMTSEDFAHFLKRIPGCMIFIGGASNSREIYPLHHSLYDYNDKTLLIGAKLFSEIVKMRLLELNN